MTIQVLQGRLRQRFSTLAVITAVNPILLEGEVWIEKDSATGRSTGRRKVGDGQVVNNVITGTTFNNLPYEPGSAAYVHTQASPATTWTINHNLGFRPSVELLDSGSQEIDGDISHPSVNQTVITLNPSTAGLARLT